MKIRNNLNQKSVKLHSSDFNIKKNKYYILAFLLFLSLVIISLFTGVYDIKNNKNGWEMFHITRISRTIALILTGISMSICGIVMQIISRNKLVVPTTTGTIEWAGLGLISTYLLIPSPTILQRTIGAIFFSFFGTIIFFFLIKRVKLQSSIVIPIVGIMFGAIISSISNFIGLMFNATQTLSVWFSGSFSTIESGRYELLWFVVVVTAIIYIYADRLTVASLGEDIAKNLGINYNQILLISTILISLTIGVVSAVIGNIPFLGLIVPNIISRFFGDNLKTNLPLVALLGASVLIACDILARIVIMPFEVPVSLILGTFGAVIFIILLLNKRGVRNE